MSHTMIEYIAYLLDKEFTFQSLSKIFEDKGINVNYHFYTHLLELKKLYTQIINIYPLSVKQFVLATKKSILAGKWETFSTFSQATAFYALFSKLAYIHVDRIKLIQKHLPNIPSVIQYDYYFKGILVNKIDTVKVLWYKVLSDSLIFISTANGHNYIVNNGRNILLNEKGSVTFVQVYRTKIVTVFHGQIIVWDLMGDKIKEFNFDMELYPRLIWNNKIVMSGKGSIFTWDIDTEQMDILIPIETEDFKIINPNLLISIEGHSVNLWDLKSANKPLKTQTFKDQSIYRLTVLPFNRVMIIGEERFSAVWNMKTNTVKILSTGGPDFDMGSSIVLPDGGFVLVQVTLVNQSVVVYDIDSEVKYEIPIMKGARNLAITLLPNNEIMVSTDRSVEIWDSDKLVRSVDVETDFKQPTVMGNQIVSLNNERHIEILE